MTPQFNCRLRKSTQDAITSNAKKAGQTIDEYLTRLVELDQNPVINTEPPTEPKREAVIKAFVERSCGARPRMNETFVKSIPQVTGSWTNERKPITKPNGKL